MRGIFDGSQAKRWARNTGFGLSRSCWLMNTSPPLTRRGMADLLRGAIADMLLGPMAEDPPFVLGGFPVVARCNCGGSARKC